MRVRLPARNMEEQFSTAQGLSANQKGGTSSEWRGSAIAVCTEKANPARLRLS